MTTLQKGEYEKAVVAMRAILSTRNDTVRDKLANAAEVLAEVGLPVRDDSVEFWTCAKCGLVLRAEVYETCYRCEEAEEGP